jgi:hypothetical protein
MGDEHEGGGHAWIPPAGYRLCATGHCGEPVATGPTKDVAEWKCDESDSCKTEGEHKCACYLVRVRPRSHHVDILAVPGKTWTDEAMPPGWHTMCLCLHEDKDAKPPPPPPLDLTPPTGYALSTACGDCGTPTYDPVKRAWSCININANADPGCYLVEVPREGPHSKQIHILAGPGKHNHDIHESHLHKNWDVFCVCLKA